MILIYFNTTSKDGIFKAEMQRDINMRYETISQECLNNFTMYGNGNDFTKMEIASKSCQKMGENSTINSS